VVVGLASVEIKPADLLNLAATNRLVAAMNSYALYGFNVMLNDRRYGLIIRWKPGSGLYPTPLYKAWVKWPNASEIEAVNFLPINAKQIYNQTHPWDWGQD